MVHDKDKKYTIWNYDRRQWLLTLDEISPSWGTFTNDLIFPQNPLGSWNIPAQSGPVQVGPGLAPLWRQPHYLTHKKTIQEHKWEILPTSIVEEEAFWAAQKLLL